MLSAEFDDVMTKAPLIPLGDASSEKVQSFWRELRIAADKIGVAFWEAVACVYVLSGMPQWTAMAYACAEYGLEADQLKLPGRTIDQWSQARRLFTSAKMREMQLWIQKANEEYKLLDSEQFAWTSRESEEELRLILSVAKDDIFSGKRLTLNTVQAILGATKELNSLKEKQVTVTVAPVVFIDESDIPE